jgi:hypothetical protein
VEEFPAKEEEKVGRIQEQAAVSEAAAYQALTHVTLPPPWKQRSACCSFLGPAHSQDLIQQSAERPDRSHHASFIDQQLRWGYRFVGVLHARGEYCSSSL